MATEYSFELTPWDLVNGIAPQLLTAAKKRASVVVERNMQLSNTEAQTAVNRGMYLELQSLIRALEAAGVTPK